ncbi:tRNA wybutosine-synthesizing protein 5 isoform X10 [Rhipicephalus microplus]|uniref:tRNA wybutosine-synthesizing protein 5 isoform X10 n=1 Tax=Rhipicephalus microplus TaxID=6941 RepID=UPI003F6D7A5F
MSTAAKTVSCYENVDEETFSSLIFPKCRGSQQCYEECLWVLARRCGTRSICACTGATGMSRCTYRHTGTWTSSKRTSSTEFYYFRTLGSDSRREPANIVAQFPELAKDVTLPKWFPDESFFSSVLRIASPQLSLWTHYDVMDNFLIQVKGKKKAVLFHPNDFEYLYIQGDKSLVLDLECPDLAKFPKFRKATRYEATLTSGDILFIPALWFHNITALDFGIAVNVFWKNLDASLYDKKDPYGNKDLIPASSALTLVEKAVKQLQLLPLDCQQFYALKMISHIKNHFGLS